MTAEIKRIHTPLSEDVIDGLEVGDRILISGKIYCGRDAVLPLVVRAIEEGKNAEYGIEPEGSVVFHTAVSPAGVGPTSSNKLEIESSIEPLSRSGVRMHLGKGALKPETVRALADNKSVFAIIAPVTALLGVKTKSKKLVAFEQLGMEAFYELDVEDYPAIIGAAKGHSIFDK